MALVKNNQLWCQAGCARRTAFQMLGQHEAAKRLCQVSSLTIHIVSLNLELAINRLGNAGRAFRRGLHCDGDLPTFS